MPLTGGPIELGRNDGGTGNLDDDRISRCHAKVALDDGGFVVTDLGSQNGTRVDGALAAPDVPTRVQRVVRIGYTLLVPCADVRPFERAGVRVIDGFVRGPAMQAVLEETERAARSGSTLHVRGETGSGKEGVVQAFHRASPRASRALVSVNCATIQHTLAERLLFGAKRGAFTSAEADSIGYVQEADGGTLFLDEVAELDPLVQAKLLRVLESREMTPVGASKPRNVDFALCSATNKDLRVLVATGALREDLYFRIATPAVTLPSLRDRPEEIPALIAHVLAGRSPAQTAHVSLVEQCLLRPWPGNIRELVSEIRAAAQAAGGERVAARHLASTAGNVFGNAASRPAVAVAAAAGGGSGPPPEVRISRADPAWRGRIEESLRAHGGNRSATARALGMHRTQLCRLIKRLGIAIEDAEDGPGESDE